MSGLRLSSQVLVAWIQGGPGLLTGSSLGILCSGLRRFRADSGKPLARLKGLLGDSLVRLNPNMFQVQTSYTERAHVFSNDQGLRDSIGVGRTMQTCPSLPGYILFGQKP